MTSRLAERLFLCGAFLCYGAQEAGTQSPAGVTLLPSASPSVAEPGVTSISVTGSNFPAGTIPAANVTVTVTVGGGNSAVTTPATAVTTVVGTTRRVSFTVPGTVSVSAPASYVVTIAGSTFAGTLFASSNAAALTVNPAASVSTVVPNTGQSGQNALGHH